MHIPENYLSPSTCAVLGAAMVPVWLVAVSKVRRHVPQEKLPLLGIAAALSFLGMMFNVPLPGGTTGHAVGGTLIAILFGPYAACLSVSVALLIQALFFGDGGILAFGANCFNMAFVLPFTGYAVYRFLRKRLTASSGEYMAAGLGAYVGINAAALVAAIEFGIQPLLFTDAAGQAAKRKVISSASDSACAPNHRPNELGMAICRCVYPGMSTCRYCSLLACSSSNSTFTASTMLRSWWRVNSFRSTSTWSLRERPECIFLPMLPKRWVSMSSTCE